MTVKKGLKTLVENNPDFSNQGLENAINEIKSLTAPSFVAKTFDLDTAITNNTVLTDSQKNDAKDTINNQPHLNIGRMLNDVVRHTDTILDGTIVFLQNPDTEDVATFLEILQTVQALQTMIPDLFGVSPAAKNRSVNDHLGSLNGVFTETTDSTTAPFVSIKAQVETLGRYTVSAYTDLANAIDDLKTFVDGVVSDSTDFQTSLDNRVNEVATQFTAVNTALGTDTLQTITRDQLISDRDRVVSQTNLETSNLSGIRTYVETLNDNISYTTLAESDDLRALMGRISQNSNWKAYFENYVKNANSLNPIFTTNTDSDKASVIEQVLIARGLPDVLDYLDIDAVLAKATRDERIDTAGFDRLTTTEAIGKCCEQLNLSTTGSVFDQSKILLDNLNQRDRDVIAGELDLNEDADTLD